MSDIFIKVIAFVIIASVMSIVLKGHLQEYSFLLVIAVVCSALAIVLSEVFPYIRTIKDIFTGNNNSSQYFSVALKALAVAYITSFASSICRDFGQTALSQVADISGKCVVFILSVPLVASILEAVVGFAGL